MDANQSNAAAQEKCLPSVEWIKCTTQPGETVPKIQIQNPTAQQAPRSSTVMLPSLLSVLVMCIVWAMSTPLHAEDAQPEWGTYAGRHLGNAEAAGTCKGYKLNGARRDEIVTIVRAAGILKELEAARSKQRADRVRAIKEDPSVYHTLLHAYGPKGIILKNYVLPATAHDIADVPGFERGIGMGIDPQQLETFGWVSNVMTGLAILNSCRGYELDPLVEGYAFALKDKISAETFAIFAVGLEKSYGKIGGSGFCTRILSENGPNSESPIVVRSKK